MSLASSVPLTDQPNDGQDQANVSEADEENNGEIAQTSHGFTFYVGMAFTLNYIIGSGFLTIPWAFSETGSLLGSILLMVLTGFAVVSAIFIVETMARASYISQFGSTLELKNRDYEIISSTSSHNPIQNFQIAKSDASMHSVDSDPGLTTDMPLLVGYNKMDLTTMCSQFLGPWGIRLYTLFVALYFYGTLWAYATVFAKSFDAIFGRMFFGGDSYYFFLFVFACFVVPISMLELTEQISLQVLLSIWRVVMMIVMIGTIALAWLYDTQAFDNFDPSTSQRDSWLYINPKKLYILLPIITYANIFHHSIPALAHPVYDKREVANIFCASLGVCCVAYLTIGLTVASYFGQNMATASNLNWANYVGCCSGSDRSTGLTIFSWLISRFVVLFPACDVASAFPLNAITLGNNLQSSLGSISSTAQTQNKARLYLFRGLASVPPIIGACFVQDLGKITNYSGLCGFAISFVFPPLLSHASESYMLRNGLPSKTYYGNIFTSNIMKWSICSFGIFVIIYVFICNAIGL